MPELKIGIQLASLRLPFKKALHMAGDLGADAVEIDARNELKPRDLSQTGMRQMRKLLNDRNLRVCAIGFRTRQGYNVVENLNRRVEATKEAMRMAYQLGTNVVVTRSVKFLPKVAVRSGICWYRFSATSDNTVSM